MTPPPPTSAAAASPSNAAARALYEVGLEHLKARRHHEAVEALRQAARLVPNEADFRAALGWALFRQAPADARAGRAAVAELRRALQLDERNRAAAQHLAEIYAQTGQPELAVQELERLLAIDPGATEVADELRRLRTHEVAATARVTMYALGGAARRRSSRRQRHPCRGVHGHHEKPPGFRRCGMSARRPPSVSEARRLLA